MNNLNQPEKKVQDKLYKYGSIVMNAKLDGTAKALLWFYAYAFNWESARPSWYSQRKICSMTGMSQSTYHNKRKYLERLGWIKVFNRGFSDSCLVGVKIGLNDPDYEKKSWAKWHPENEKKAKQEALATYLAESSQVLQNNDTEEPSDTTEEVQEDTPEVPDDIV